MSESGTYLLNHILSEVMAASALLCKRNLVLAEYGNTLRKGEWKQGGQQKSSELSSSRSGSAPKPLRSAHHFVASAIEVPLKTSILGRDKGATPIGSDLTP